MKLDKKGIKKVLEVYTKASMLELYRVTAPSLNKWLSSDLEPKQPAVIEHINRVTADYLKLI